VVGTDAQRQAQRIAKFDNLGEGASGTAVQNLMLMLRRQSSFRHPGLAQAVVHPFSSREIDGIVAIRLGPESRDREARVELQAGARRFARFFETIEMRQRRREAKPSHRRIRIELFRAVEPFERSLVAALMEFG
jgi:hypothetical protein